MQRDQTPPQAPERLLDLHRPGPDGLRHDAAGSARSVGGAGPAEAQAAHAASGGDAGGAEGVEAGGDAALSGAVEIYGLIDPGTGALRYIGKANNSHKRLASHIRDSRRRSTPVYAWIRKLADFGLEPDLLVLSICGDESWQWEERRLIASARSQGLRLLNVADGGDEPHCPPHVRAMNARKQYEGRRNDPFKFAVHAFLREAGQQLATLKKIRPQAPQVARLSAALEKCKSMDRELLGYRLAKNPRTRRHFPASVQPLLGEFYG